MGLPITARAQLSDPGALVSLLSIDLTAWGAGVAYFTPGTTATGQEIVFDGITYPPVPVQVEGIEKSSSGPIPRPLVRIANVNRAISALLRDYDDLVGATVTHILTLVQYLDAVNFPGGNSDADPGQYIGPEIYRVERKVRQNKLFVELELSASIDQQDRKLPGRQVLRDVCPWIYRRPDPSVPGQFIYDNTTMQCPYTGGACFDRRNNPTDAAHDDCSRTLEGCAVRFGQFEELPFGGFPGAGLSG